MKRRSANNPKIISRRRTAKWAVPKWAGTLFIWVLIACACFIPACFNTAVPQAQPAAAPADLEHAWFPNLVSAPQSIFIDASLIPSPATAAIFGAAQGPDFGDIFLPMAGTTIAPDRFYLVELRLIRDRNIDGLYPAVSLFGESVRLSDFWAEGKPQKFSLFFHAPSRALTGAERRLAIRIPRGDYRLVIEDVSVRAFVIVPLWPDREEHFTPALARSVAPALTPPPTSSTTVDFYWQMPETDRLLEVRIVVRPTETEKMGREIVRRPGGASGSRVPPTAPLAFSTANTDESRCISVPRDHIPPGLSQWRFEVRQYRTLLAASEWREIDNAMSAGAAQRPTQANPLQAQSVPAALPEIQITASTFDPSFFPIGIYGASPADYAELGAAGFNMVHASARDLNGLKTKLDAARTYGLKLLLSPGPLLREIEKSGGADISESLRAALLDGVAAWYLDDEPEGRSVSPKSLYRTRRELLRLGLGRPGAIALLRSWRARDYAPAIDIFMSDPYPIPFEPLSWMSDCLDEIGRTIAGDPAKRVWAVIQAFPWNSVSSDPALAAGRAPTPSELRALITLALNHGARGIFFYALESGRYKLRDDKPLWEAVKSAVAELRAKSKDGKK